MPSFIKPILLPAAFLLVFSAEECESDYAVEVREEITVLPDASVEVALEHEANSMGRLLDWDPPPSLERGWDSVHLGLSGKEDYALRAWVRFPPGADLPGSHARAGDPLSDWYVHFPSDLAREERGDTIFFHYRRSYPALDWLPMELFQGLLEEGDRLDSLIASSWGELESLSEGLEDRWEGVGPQDEPETEADSLLFRQFLKEFKDLVQVGDPPLIQAYRQLSENSIRTSYLSGVALVIPAEQSLSEKADPGCSSAVMDLILDPLDEVKITSEGAWSLLLEELGIDPGLGREEGGFDDEAEIQSLRAQTLERIRETLLTECRYSGEALITFDRRLEWLARRYRIVGGKLRNQSFRIHLSMPGELLETNADTVIAGRARWEFSLRGLTGEDVHLKAMSRVIR